MVIFDEAHNLESNAESAVSYELTCESLGRAIVALREVIDALEDPNDRAEMTGLFNVRPALPIWDTNWPQIVQKLENNLQTTPISGM